MHRDKLVASLDVVAQLLTDPEWSVKARKVKTLKGMRQILFDFCKTNGKVMRLDKDILYVCL